MRHVQRVRRARQVSQCRSWTPAAGRTGACHRNEWTGVLAGALAKRLLSSIACRGGTGEGEQARAVGCLLSVLSMQTCTWELGGGVC